MSAGTLCKCSVNAALGLAIWYTIPISLRPLQSAAAATQQPAADEVVDDDEMNHVASYLLRTLERNYILFQMFQNNDNTGIAPYGRNFRGAGGRSDQCSVNAQANRTVLGFDVFVDREPERTYGKVYPGERLHQQRDD